ncbi:hypothetical protein BDF21DRAFT_414628 [Thamnidium elegans]|nr:hypothetical protein BDF21DRAFT_414628 [Thamnidium elegans]
METSPLAPISSTPTPIAPFVPSSRPTRNITRSQANNLSDAETIIERIVDREHSFRQGQLQEFREYMAIRADRSDSLIEALLVSRRESNALIAQNIARMRELQDQIRQQGPHQ